VGVDRVDTLCRALKARGERITPARRRVLEMLVAADRHLNAEQILDGVQQTNPEIHRATVYRTLESLTRLGITEHTHLGHGPAVYHLIDDTHHHLVCERCGAVIEVQATLFRNLEKKVLAEHGFQMRPRHFATVGRCRVCASQPSEQTA
jgi:Fe2+ or Zn2+ uptake regulation protein